MTTTITLTASQVSRVFQALATETARLESLRESWSVQDTIDEAAALRDQFAGYVNNERDGRPHQEALLPVAFEATARVTSDDESLRVYLDDLGAVVEINAEVSTQGGKEYRADVWASVKAYAGQNWEPNSGWTQTQQYGSDRVALAIDGEGSASLSTGLILTPAKPVEDDEDED